MMGATRADDTRDHAAERTALMALGAAIVIGVVIRLFVFRGGGFPSDVGTFMAWAKRMADVGPQHFYAQGYFSDYPPGFLYVLWVIGVLFDGEALRLVVKGLSIPADIALSIFLYRIVRPYAGAAVGALAGALWILQPGPIFAGPFWGQVDSWGTLPFLGALIAAGAGRWAWAGALAGIAGVIKPQFGLVALVVGAAAAIELIRFRRWDPLLRTVGGGIGAAVLIALPFWIGADQPMTPVRFVQLVKDASETYPYTSLFAFNIWSIVGDFWKPDEGYVVIGGVLLVAGLIGSVVPLWWRRDTGMLLACGACAAMAFYFLPTRAHERYLFPAFAILLPFAVMRSRVLWPYVVLALAFFISLYFAFTRYAQNGLTPAPLLESTVFQRNGQILLAAVMLGSAAIMVWRLLFRGDAVLEATATPPGLAALTRPLPQPVPAAPAPSGLLWGHAPARRDITLALIVALAVVGTRGFRLDQPRDMYFDEVYHARTAFELLAQREPYEWTHPHLAKEIMALGILAFGGDGVEGSEGAPDGARAFAVSNEGRRAYGFADGRIEIRDRGGAVSRTLSLGRGAVRALSVDGTALIAASDSDVAWFDLTAETPTALRREPLAAKPVGLVAVHGTAVVATAQAIEIHPGPPAAPRTVPVAAVALTVRGDSNTVFAAEAGGAIHLIDAGTGQETGRVSGGGPPTALAYAQGPDRLFAARADSSAVDWYEMRSEGGAPGTFGGTVPLENGRTGEPGIAHALALVPRTQFLYALTDRAAVVIETHGASPFAAIPVSGSMLGVDGAADEIVVAGTGSASLIPTGRHALAWRIPGVLFGALLAFFVVLLARRLFASDLVAAFAGAAVVLDGSMFAQARIGMNDIYVAAFLVAGWYFVVAAHAPRRSAALDLALAGAFFGLGAASKWAAFYSLAGLGLLSVIVTVYAWYRGRPGTGGPFDLAAPRGPRRLLRGRGNAPYLFLCFFVLPVAIYLASYVGWFGGPMVPFKWNLWELTQQMYWYHSGLTAPHPAGSPWWSWPLVLKPVYWYLGQPGPNQTAVIYDAGNVVLFWGALAAFVWAVVTAIRTRSVPLAILVFGLLTQYVAWVPITRVLFFYHFFTALPFYLLILAAALTALWGSGRRSLVTAYVALAAAAFAFFYPFISGLPIPGDLGSVYTSVLPTWQYDCQFYPAFKCDTGRLGSVASLSSVAVTVVAAAAIGLLAFAALALAQNGSGARLRALVARSLPRPPASP